MSNISIREKILEELIRLKPDDVKSIESHRGEHKSYPTYTYDFICDTLKNSLEMLTHFCKIFESHNDETEVYDSIFQINENKIKDEQELLDDESPDSNEEETTIDDESQDSNEEETTIDDESPDFYEEETTIDDESQDSNEGFIIDIEEEEEEEVEVVEEEKPDENQFDDLCNYFHSFHTNQMACIQKVSSKLNISIDATYNLLKKFEWDIKILLEYWVHNNENLRDFLNEIEPVQNEYVGIGTCDICCDEKVDLYRHSCGHIMCFDCSKKEIECQIEKQRFPVVCRCDGCNQELMLCEIMFFCGEEVATKYCHKNFKRQMLLDGEHINCPAPDCENILDLKSITPCKVCKCPCGKQICVECKQDSHAPLTCEQVEKWNQISQEMKQLEETHNAWLRHEIKLWTKNQRNIEEVEKAYKIFVAKLKVEFEKEDENEINEIKEIKNQISKETNTEKLNELKQKLAERESVHNYKVEERKRMLEYDYIQNYQQEIIEMCNKDIYERGDIPTNKTRKHKKYKIEYVKAEVKKCPKCKAEIVKDGGCNHMKCHHCQHEFCWKCLEDWKTHGNRYNDCPNAKSEQKEKPDINNSNDTDLQTTSKKDNDNNNQNNDDTEIKTVTIGKRKRRDREFRQLRQFGQLRHLMQLRQLRQLRQRMQQRPLENNDNNNENNNNINFENQNDTQNHSDDEINDFNEDENNASNSNNDENDLFSSISFDNNFNYASNDNDDDDDVIDYQNIRQNRFSNLFLSRNQNAFLPMFLFGSFIHNERMLQNIHPMNVRRRNNTNMNGSDYTPINRRTHFDYFEYEYEYEYDEDEDEEKDKTVDRKFELSPLIGKTKSRYSDWKYFNDKKMRLINSKERQQRSYSEFGPYIRNSIDQARSVLIHSYELLFLLENGSIISARLELYVDKLEKLFWKTIYSLQSDELVDFSDRLYQNIETLLVYANFFNF